MSIVSNEFKATLQKKVIHASLKRQEQMKSSVATLLVQSNNVYKGEFAVVAELNKISAYAGDYADVYETNTRWAFVNGAWSNTKQPIPINPILATKQDVNALDKRVASLEIAIENPTLIITKI